MDEAEPLWAGTVVSNTCQNCGKKLLATLLSREADGRVLYISVWYHATTGVKECHHG